jgi:hypothetical protein
MIISYNENEEMMSIKDKNGKIVFYGNYWDFPKTPKGIKDLFDKLGIPYLMDDNLPSCYDSQ